MPLYEYACESCGHRFELIRKFSDPPLDQCPQCAGGPVQKLLSSPAIQFKGSGWYITDYAKKAPAAGDSSSGEKSDTKSDDKKGDTGEAAAKPAAKTDSAPASPAPAKSTSES